MCMDDEKRPRRITGHKLTMEWSGEYGEESSSTGECPCGWTESGSNQDVVRFEYGRHLDRVWEGKKKDALRDHDPAWIVIHIRTGQASSVLAPSEHIAIELVADGLEDDYAAHSVLSYPRRCELGGPDLHRGGE